MQIASQILIALVAAEHLYIVWLEMFAWETAGRRVFRGAMKPELFTPTKTLAANQGLYNGFLAAGLIWSFLIGDPVWSRNVALFFLGCVAVAGIFGGATASRRIFFVQAVPALLAIGACLLQSPSPKTDLETERQALLALHESDRANHFKADAEALLTSQGEEVISVNGGKIERIEKSKSKDFFNRYFKNAKYSEWDNLEQPVVQISPDGKLAWMVVRVKVSRTQPDSTGQEVPRKFIYAGLTAYEKKDGRWQASANASTFADYDEQ